MNEAAAVATIAVLTAIGAAVILLRQRADAPLLEAAGDVLPAWTPEDAWTDDSVFQDTVMQTQEPDLIDATLGGAANLADSFAESIGFSAPIDTTMATINENAFLGMIAYAEGTAAPRGHEYWTLFGGGRMASLADHPAIFFDFTNGKGQKLKTSAAGRYQFLLRTWRDLANKLNLPDFGPESQDRAALELIRQRGALKDVQAGRISEAIRKVAPIWASLPGAGYSQPERALPKLLASYTAAGGNLEA